MGARERERLAHYAAGVGGVPESFSGTLVDTVPRHAATDTEQLEHAIAAILGRGNDVSLWPVDEAKEYRRVSVVSHTHAVHAVELLRARKIIDMVRRLG